MKDGKLGRTRLESVKDQKKLRKKLNVAARSQKRKNLKQTEGCDRPVIKGRDEKLQSGNEKSFHDRDSGLK